MSTDMTTLADYVAGADEEARIMWANECDVAAHWTVAIAQGL